MVDQAGPRLEGSDDGSLLARVGGALGGELDVREPLEERVPKTLMEVLSARIVESARAEMAANTEVLGTVVTQVGRLDRHLANLAEVLRDDYDSQHRQVLADLNERLTKIEDLLLREPSPVLLAPGEVERIISGTRTLVAAESKPVLDTVATGLAGVTEQLTQLRRAVIDGLREAASSEAWDAALALVAEELSTLRSELRADVDARGQADASRAAALDRLAGVAGLAEALPALTQVVESLPATLTAELRRLESKVSAPLDLSLVTAAIAQALAATRDEAAQSRSAFSAELQTVRDSLDELAGSGAGVAESLQTTAAELSARQSALERLETTITDRLSEILGSIALAQRRVTDELAELLAAVSARGRTGGLSGTGGPGGSGGPGGTDVATAIEQLRSATSAQNHAVLLRVDELTKTIEEALGVPRLTASTSEVDAGPEAHRRPGGTEPPAGATG